MFGANVHWCHHREGLEWGSRMQWSFMGQTGRKMCRKMSKGALARAPLRKLLLAQGSRASPMPSPPCPALLLRGCHGPALHAAPPPAPGQTERQPAAHLPALPHQALMPQHMCGLTSGPIVCPLGCLPLLFQFSTPRSPHPLSQSLQAPGKDGPETESAPSPYSILTQSLALLLPAPSPLGSRGQAGPPFLASQAALNEALLGEAEPHRGESGQPCLNTRRIHPHFVGGLTRSRPLGETWWPCT